MARFSKPGSQDRASSGTGKVALWLRLNQPREAREDGQGRWYVNFVCEDLTPERAKTGKEAGVDLGLKTLASLSDGVAFTRENLTRSFEVRLATAQRARKRSG